MENSMEVPQKIKYGTALWPSDSTSGNSSEETQNTNAKEYKHVPVLCSIVYDSQDMEAAQVPISKLVDKKVVAHMCNKILLGHKKEWNCTTCAHIDGDRGYYANWNKSVRERQIPYGFTNMWNAMNKLN